MKKVILTLLLAAISLVCTAQTEELFLQKEVQLNKELNKARKAKDTPACEMCCLNLLRLFYTQSEEIQKDHPLAGGYYYDLSCYQSRQGKLKAAVKSFSKAYELGFDDFDLIKSDPDLDNIRKDETFKRLYEELRATNDYLNILQSAGDYIAGGTDSLPHFTYAAPNDRNLVRVRAYFKLDSVAGAGDELSKIRNILTYIHNTIRHDGQNENPTPMNAIAMAEACKDDSRGLNCRGLATVLAECYLSMGFPARIVTCIPKVYISDCHVINVVYSATLDKWVWVDPTENAWVLDENGVMLSIREVRERLRNGQTLLLNDDANWNNCDKTLKEVYLDSYMAKNLYYMTCTDRTCFGTEYSAEGEPRARYTALIPLGYDSDFLHRQADHTISDDTWFWQSPYKE